MACPTPSLLTICGGGQTRIGEVPAAQVKDTVTSVLFQPAAFGAGEADTVMRGGVFSILSVRFAGAEEFPATSTAVPEKV